MKCISLYRIASLAFALLALSVTLIVPAQAAKKTKASPALMNAAAGGKHFDTVIIDRDVSTGQATGKRQHKPVR